MPEPYTFKPLAFVQDETLYHYHYHLDHLGTPQEITNANGEIVWAASFKAYGNLAAAIKSDIENNIRFQGKKTFRDRHSTIAFIFLATKLVGV